jgi:hypothetical protein
MLAPEIMSPLSAAYSTPARVVPTASPRGSAKYAARMPSVAVPSRTSAPRLSPILPESARKNM